MPKRNIADYANLMDFVTSGGDWDCTHADLVDQDILILEYREIETQHGAAFLAECLTNAGPVVALIGAQVLMKQLKEAQDNLPLRARIAKQGRYYIFAHDEATDKETREAIAEEIPF